MSDPRSVAQTIVERAKDLKIRFPKTLDDNQIRTACGTILMKHRLDDLSFDEDAVITELTEKYGLEAPVEPSDPGVDKKRRRKKGEIADDEKEGENDDDSSSKKKKKTVEYKVPENKPICDAIREMASIYFKNQDAKAGGVYAKAAKAIREWETQIVDKKTALTVKGVGPSIAGSIVEFLTTGSITKLENLRAGIA